MCHKHPLPGASWSYGAQKQPNLTWDRNCSCRERRGLTLASGRTSNFSSNKGLLRSRWQYSSVLFEGKQNVIQLAPDMCTVTLGYKNTIPLYSGKQPIYPEPNAWLLRLPHCIPPRTRSPLLGSNIVVGAHVNIRVHAKTTHKLDADFQADNTNTIFDRSLWHAR